jgi:hypothetical protein
LREYQEMHSRDDDDYRVGIEGTIKRDPKAKTFFCIVNLKKKVGSTVGYAF